MDEESSLTGGGKRGKPVLYAWWALNVAIVVFVFLAFLMSTLAFTHSKQLANSINTTYLNNQGILIENKYKVATPYSVKRGSVVSYCDDRNNELCEGLGPIWGLPFTNRASWSPAVQNSMAQLSHLYSLYVYVVEADHNTLHATFVDTHGAYPMTTNGTDRITLSSPVTSIHARVVTETLAVIMYTTANETYLQTIVVTPQGGSVKFTALAQALFPIHDPTYNGTLVRNVETADTWILVSSGYFGQGAQYEVFVIDNTAPTLLRKLSLPHWTFGVTVDELLATKYLGHGFIVQSNAHTITLGKIDTTQNTLSLIQSATYLGGVWFRFLTITQLEGDALFLVGTQVDFVDTPKTVSLFVQWSNISTTNALRVHWPTNLLANMDHLLTNDQVSVCYHPPTAFEPHGGIFFTYVDALSRRAKIARARAVWVADDLHAVPSPSLDISSHQYGRYHSWLAPHLTCPVGNTKGVLLIVIQDLAATFNSFVWSGGYRYAGIAQNSGNSGAELNVVRAGMSVGFDRLVPGFTYYIWNNGSIAPFTSIFETFTPNGYPFPVGTAITEGRIHLEPEAFERFGW